MSRTQGSGDLAAFLAARLDEDERVARLARASYFTPEVLGAFSAVGDMAHVIRHDPARVFREVAAKRALLAQAVADYMDSDDYSNEQRVEAEINSLGILRALAAIYSDHPDYRQEWAS